MTGVGLIQTHLSATLSFMLLTKHHQATNNNNGYIQRYTNMERGNYAD